MENNFLAVMLTMARLVLRAIINHMQSTKARMLTKATETGIFVELFLESFLLLYNFVLL